MIFLARSYDVQYAILPGLLVVLISIKCATEIRDPRVRKHKRAWLLITAIAVAYVGYVYLKCPQSGTLVLPTTLAIFSFLISLFDEIKTSGVGIIWTAVFLVAGYWNRDAFVLASFPLMFLAMYRISTLFEENQEINQARTD
jgi:hypothetical protein